MCLLVLLLCTFSSALIKRLVFDVLKIAALVCLKCLVCRLVLCCKLAKNSIEKRLSENVSVAVSSLDLAVSLIWVYAKRNV